ncbi:hypothetical protein HYT02_01185 [Candidatus Gottesmanbacteria bacterium]|nr:hypothetical protein [Candidatus Gottesmanbacteria bacterium]
MAAQKPHASTQYFTQIEDISDDLVILTNGGAALVVETSAVNFELLSEEEQEAIIYSYNAFLNSLSFPIQVEILSRQMDVSAYLNYIAKQQEKTQNTRFKIQLEKYHSFISGIVKENRVLEKKFFMIIPFSPLELGIKGGFSLFGPKKSGLPFSKNYILTRAKTALIPKRDHLIRQLGRLGIKGTQLTTGALIELFYELFNSSQEDVQKVPQGADFSTVMVSRGS